MPIISSKKIYPPNGNSFAIRVTLISIRVYLLPSGPPNSVGDVGATVTPLPKSCSVTFSLRRALGLTFLADRAWKSRPPKILETAAFPRERRGGIMASSRYLLRRGLR